MLTTDIRNDKQYFMSIWKSADQRSTQETPASFRQSILQRPRGGGLGLARLAAGVKQASDLNSICPHAKAMNAIEGEWHLAWDNHPHPHNIHTKPAALVYSTDPVMLLPVNRHTSGWSSW